MKLLDTSVVVAIDGGGIDEKVEKLDEQGRHVISMVTVTELRLGVDLQYDRGTDRHQQARDDLDRLVSRFDVQPVTRPVATTAASIIAALEQRREPLDDLHDIYIGATARTQQLPILTGNVDHFDRIEDVQVLDWADF